ncbi:IgGFc-binding protein-like [Leptodactylus fuscus]|uniref:IgGFc-binding protein-like n=1 Tax=Leptodactylus fuscus TaxID=238119 RepID=UPI003F4F0984
MYMDVKMRDYSVVPGGPVEIPIGPNGLPVVPGGPAEIPTGPNGLPVVPGGPGGIPIGPSGLPVVPGGPGAVQIGPNGLPLLPGGPGENPVGLKATSSGRKFITFFLQNGINDRPLRREIQVTAASARAKVSVSLSKSDFKKEMTVEKGQTAVIPIPTSMEMKGTGSGTDTVKIESNVDITVMSKNYKGNSGDKALIYPVDQMGLEYYIITPPSGPKDQYKEFIIISHENPTTVDIYPKIPITWNGINYSKGDKMTLNLKPFENFQIQSEKDLSGTRVVGDHNIVVITGHTCAQNNIGCSHVYEQLKPIEDWGTSFLIPGLPFQFKNDSVFIMMSQKTSIKYQSGRVNVNKEVPAGDLLQIKVNPSSPLSIQSSHGIQVLFHSLGGICNGKTYGSFLTRIQDTNSFGLGYSLIGEAEFDTNLGILIAKTTRAPGIQINAKSPTDIVWNKIPKSEFSWAEYTYGSGTHTIQHPTDPFGLLSIGYGLNKSYGSLAPCFRGTLQNNPSQSIGGSLISLKEDFNFSECSCNVDLLIFVFASYLQESDIDGHKVIRFCCPMCTTSPNPRLTPLDRD